MDRSTDMAGLECVPFIPIATTSYFILSFFLFFARGSLFFSQTFLKPPAEGGCGAKELQNARGLGWYER
jgi:hypothetical protein